MRFSSLVERIGGQGAEAWQVHFDATRRAEAGEDVIFFSIGDPDFATPAPIVERAVAALRAGDTHYTELEGRLELRAAIADRFAKRAGVAVAADNVVVVPGTQNALFAASLCLLDHGDEVLGFDPMYVTYEATLRAGGADLVPVPTGPGFRIDVERVAAAITPRTKAIAFATPSNPTGVVATAEELNGLAGLAVEHDLWVIADEVYADLIYEGEHRSIAGLDGMAERAVTVSSLSKSHAMTGWRCGWLIGPRDLADHVARLTLPMLYGIPGFVQEAAIEALAMPVDEMRATYRRRRDLACKVLSAELPVLSPEGGMYVMVDVRGRGLSSGEFSLALLERKGVSALDAGAFGPNAEGWLRLAFTIGEERLEEGCHRIVEMARELPVVD
ncbi:MAG: aminotransferase class I/II-fold pyridoxal phosphate-dependent enzyme [Acidimicrobiia bacterium]|nr:aminotransferase class I/II-fold pyridoxal phosphate-dependent enzyme [Acidimicrobiia bacterium]